MYSDYDCTFIFYTFIIRSSPAIPSSPNQLHVNVGGKAFPIPMEMTLLARSELMDLSMEVLLMGTLLKAVRKPH